MITKDIINFLEEKYPRSNAEEWDNVGLLVGNNKKDVKKIQLSIDATEKAVDYAAQNNVDMIVTHHPLIFKPLKSIVMSELSGRKIIKLIENGLNLYSIHTNLDSSKDGLNDYILELLEVKKYKIIDINANDETAGIGRMYTLEEKITILEYADFIKTKMKIKNVRVISNDLKSKVKKIALINGSGMSYWRKVKSLGADLFITGDIGYHDALDAKESGLHLIDIGHFESENCFSELLKKNLEEIGLEVLIFNDGPVFENY
ncbi:Nif3-like dinuclear metal center hexameric protein [Fusobacterium ulcerans]|jgi:dinuclear metal center YbgI/SA1388 family protein|uniref:Metal-binding protein n=2 Tax=Fusobacterium ulcerans TaxID=861 RepID=A0AAX2JGJ1_9FUSO|nr:Nif3-like dinuclear metal center hexameric protein [Fusobacterium ulcerans]AVQ27816.1 Nif3-like dinuclear metal center hexameric protein [Fusobacterium ulcerans]EFS27593.1 YbgI/family dinuclear metal center protein [Fusobacterium ulcerans ATCC 49185]EHO76976.1 YbgI/family dinuclear metal center protein [Fusobacterium ulcerans 12-1B]MCB8566367.1 Nif3-like dinuclear metal center hexameric protein [Fusobacterium ulcerans]MCB8650497.1 Nif3-like dinuclear metal center hexameric protein [Fusobact